MFATHQKQRILQRYKKDNYVQPRHMMMLSAEEIDAIFKNMENPNIAGDIEVLLSHPEYEKVFRIIIKYKISDQIFSLSERRIFIHNKCLGIRHMQAFIGKSHIIDLFIANGYIIVNNTRVHDPVDYTEVFAEMLRAAKPHYLEPTRRFSDLIIITSDNIQVKTNLNVIFALPALADSCSDKSDEEILETFEIARENGGKHIWRLPQCLSHISGENCRKLIEMIHDRKDIGNYLAANPNAEIECFAKYFGIPL